MKTEKHEYAYMYGEMSVVAEQLADFVLFESNSRNQSTQLQTAVLDRARSVHKLLRDHENRIEERAEYAASRF